MAPVVVIALVVALVAIRLTIPPWPNFLKMGIERWGKTTTFVLFAIAVVGAVAALVISRL